MTRSTRSVWLLGLLLVGLVAQACAPAPTPTPSPPPGVTLSDALGNTVYLEQLPRRIVVAGKNSLSVLDNLFLFPEAKGRVVGYSVAGKQSPASFLSTIEPGFGEKPTLKADAAAEQVAALQPDAVVMKSLNYETLGKPLQALGIPVICLDLETPEQFKRDVAIVGQLFGNRQRSEEILSFVQRKLDAVSRGLQGLMDEQRPRVLLVQYSETGGEVAVSVPPGAWLQTVEVEMAGGAPVWKGVSGGSGWNVVNLEQVAAWNPDVILVAYYSGDPREVVAKLRDDARWQALKAVKEGRIYGFAGDFFSWDQPDPRWVLGVTWLAGMLHPQRFAGLNMLQEVSDFFGEMYGMDAATVQAKIIPNLKGDVP